MNDNMEYVEKYKLDNALYCIEYYMRKIVELEDKIALLENGVEELLDAADAAKK